ncbi:MAG TPA: O-antigen ligase family protein, partial [Thermoanaerobaculia bacterium]|nr:O-antigen ligase family protein [Thermoanaerobaculia bacterium]
AERKMLLVTPPLVAWLALLIGLVLTGSRAGLLAAVVGAAVQGALLAWPRRRWKLAPVGLVVVLVGLGIVAGVASLSAFGRLGATSFDEVAWGARSEVAGRTLGLWGRFPVTGSGLGTYADAYATVEPTGQLAGLWLHAHNDYLELLATGGPIAALLVMLALLALLRRLSRVLARGRRSEDRAAALAALGALAAVAVHEAFDFGLTMPAVAVILAVVCGAGAGARTAHRRPVSARREAS